MADNVTVDNGGLTDYVVVSDEITSPYTGGTAQAGAVKILDGTANGATPVAAGGGVEANALRVTLASDSTGVLSVDDNGGSLTVDGTVAVSGTVTVDGSGVTQPVSDGGGALSVDDNGGSLTVDSTQLPSALVSGRLDVNVGATAIPAVVTVEAAYTAAQTDTAIVSATSPDRIVVTRILVTCDNANTVDVGLRMGFGAANTPTTTGVVASHPGVPPGGGFNSGDGSGVLGIGAAGEDLRITSEVPTTGSLRVVVSYYLTT